MTKSYDYICRNCGNKVSVRPINYPPPVSCTNCGANFSFIAKEEEDENDMVNARETT